LAESNGLITLREAAERCGFTYGWARALAARDKFATPTLRIGRQRYYKRSAVSRWDSRRIRVGKARPFHRRGQQLETMNALYDLLARVVCACQ
jgi:hypothetical protein